MNRFPEVRDGRNNPWMREPVQRTDALNRKEWLPKVPCGYMQVEALMDIGRFRAVSLDYLAKYVFFGDPDRASREIGTLAAKRLLFVQHIVMKSGPMKVITLNKDGLHEVRSRTLGNEQKFYSGLARLREIEHDTDVYGMYRREQKLIEDNGGKIVRILLEAELKREVLSPLNQKQNYKTKEYQRLKEELAEKHELSIGEDGSVMFPDVRVEYLNRDMQLEKVDLELSTDSYKPHQIAAKVSAGMKVYGHHGIPISGLRTSSGSPGLLTQEPKRRIYL